MIRAILIACLLAGSFAVPVAHAETARVLPSDPVHPFATVSALSGNAAKRLKDGDLVQTAGYTTAGDKGGDMLVYHSTGRSGITADGGWLHNGPRSDDYFQSLDYGVIANVRKFGAKGDFDPATGTGTDDTAAFEAARDAWDSLADAYGDTGVSGGGVIYVPPTSKAYGINFKLTVNSAARNAKMVGDGAGSLLTSYSDGGFAVALDNNRFAAEPFTFPTIEGVSFTGVRGGTAKISCGLCLARRCNLRNVNFHSCLIGMANTDNYYGAWRDINIEGCDVGMLSGNFNSATISDLEDGDGAATATLPVVSANATGHSGNKLVDHLRVNSCRVGVAFLGTNNIGTVSSEMMFIKPTIEACDVGFWMQHGSARIDMPWFEANASGASTQTVNGETASDSDIFVDGSFGWVSTVRVDGGRVETAEATDRGQLHLNGTRLTTADILATTGGTVRAENVRADAKFYPFEIIRPQPSLTSGNRAIGCHTPLRVNRVYEGAPQGGTVLVGEDFTGAALGSSRLSTYASGTRTFETAGGFYSDSKCLLQNAATDRGFGLTVSSDFTTDRFTVLSFAVKPAVDMTASLVGLSGVYVITDGASAGLADCPADVWTQITLLSRWTEASGGSNPVLIFSFSGGGNQDLEFGNIQLVQFNSVVDAAEFASSDKLYLEEIP